jgi:hypothetical protein
MQQFPPAGSVASRVQVPPGCDGLPRRVLSSLLDRWCFEREMPPWSWLERQRQLNTSSLNHENRRQRPVLIRDVKRATKTGAP